MWTAKASLVAMFLPRIIFATTIFPLGSMIAVSQIRAYALSEEWDFEMPFFMLGLQPPCPRRGDWP